MRPSVLGDRGMYRAAVDRWIAISDVVKLSEDDLHWLHPEAGGLSGAIDIARGRLVQGPRLVVITRGAAGLVGVTAERVIEVPGVAVNVIDTVGAGDTVGAVLVEGIMSHGVHGLCGDQLLDVLERAAHAAAITCSREGAQPPCAAEMPT